MSARIFPRIAAPLLLAILLAVLGLAAGTIRATAQTVDLDATRISVSPIDAAWSFHLGDDARWSEPGFDDSNWPVLHPQDDWTSQGYPVKTELAWFRFHLRVAAHTQSMVMELPEIDKSFQLFCDGQLIGQVGTLPPGPAHNVIGADRVFTLPVNTGASAKEVTVALRVWQDPAIAGTRGSVLYGEAFAGSPGAVLTHFARSRAIGLLSYGTVYTVGIVQLIVGTAAFMLFWFTRERFYLWFASSLIFEISFLPFELFATHNALGFYLYTDIEILIDLLAVVAYVLFIVSAVHPDKWRPAIPPVAMALLAELSLILVLKHAIPLQAGNLGYSLSNIAMSLTLGWILVRGWRAGNLYAKLIFLPFAVKGTLNILSNLGPVFRDAGISLSFSLYPSHYVLLHDPFQVTLADVEVLIVLLGMLAVLVYRFARTSLEQQRLTTSLQAARDIQQRLVPVDIPSLGGLHTEIAYRAAEEVGGDFCQILPRPDGSIFVAIGDVSGKGLQAAMVGAVAVGALRSIAADDLSAAAALERLNQVLLLNRDSGFVTCICLILTSTGEISIANAGHLSPYLNGVELDLPPGLPLGVASGIEYEQATFVLPAAARLTLLSDGVVEARAQTGELFGFERTAEVSQLPASEIASRAHLFGQEDDITIITLDWKLPDAPMRSAAMDRPEAFGALPA
jgi:Stage II sporulation protein E (SpoIIE)